MRRNTGRQPGTKSGFRPAHKPRSIASQPLVCFSIGLHRVSFVRASRDTPRRVFFDRLGGNRGGCLLGEPARRRPVLPVPAPPRRPAVRRPVPTCPWYVRVLDSTGYSKKGEMFFEDDISL